MCNMRVNAVLVFLAVLRDVGIASTVCIDRKRLLGLLDLRNKAPTHMFWWLGVLFIVRVDVSKSALRGCM